MYDIRLPTVWVPECACWDSKERPCVVACGEVDRLCKSETFRSAKVEEVSVGQIGPWENPMRGKEREKISFVR